MTEHPAIALFGLLEHVQFAVLALRHDLGGDSRALDLGPADLRLAGAADEQNVVELQLRTHLALELLHLDALALFDAMLLSTRANHCVHDTPPRAAFPPRSL